MAAPEAAAGQPQGWYYLDANQQSQGPFDVTYLQALDQQGYFANPETLFWREGMGADWKPLRDLDELRQHLTGGTAAAGAGAGAAGVGGAEAAAGAGSGGGGNAQRRKGAAAAAAPAVTADPQLAGFLSEISALEAEAEAEAAGGEGGGDVPPSPPADERSFEDDDGTMYVWDSRLRKFMPMGEEAAVAGGAAGAGAGSGAAGGPAAAAAAAVPAAAPVVSSYNEDDMVFVPDEEQLPEYQPPPKYGDLEDNPEEGEEAGAGGRQQQQQQGAGGGDAQQPAATGEAAGGQASNGAAAAAAAAAGDKRSAQAAALEAAREKAKKAKEAKQQQQQQGWFELKVNTSVYVSGLPDDVSEAELMETFSKCGVIKEDLEGRPRIKIYRDKTSGRPKGDGLITYLKEPSVDLALQILDGTPLRYGLPPMAISRAKFEQKGDTFVARQPAGKKVAKKKLERLERQALGWGGFDDALKPQQITVILKNMFHPDEFVESPFYKEELEGDIKGECAKLGKVDKVRVFHGHPAGVVSVKFTTAEAADECVRVMNGRFFGGRQLEAAKWDGFTNYNIKVKESEEEQQARLERFAAELEAAGGDTAAAEAAVAAAQPMVAEPGDQ